MRAKCLENECNILKKRVDKLEHEITRTEKEQIVRCKEITDTSCQTDDTISEVSNRSELSKLSSMKICHILKTTFKTTWNIF